MTSSEDGFVKVWHTKDGSVQRIYDHKCAVNDVVIHPNQGELVACDRAGGVKIWDLSANLCAQELYPEEDVSMASVTVASDGSLLCAGNNSVMPVRSGTSVRYPADTSDPTRAMYTSGE